LPCMGGMTRETSNAAHNGWLRIRLRRNRAVLRSRSYE
jgi:hypothetical protein